MKKIKLSDKQKEVDPKAERIKENISAIKQCADMLTLEETEILINYLKRKFKIEFH